MSSSALAAFGIYFTILLIIGLVAHKKNTTEADFVLGGRALNFWVTALSAHASDMSSWLFMAFPMAIFVSGLSASWIALGLLIGMFLSWQFVAPKLRSETERFDAFTLSSYFEKRFADESGVIRFVSAVATMLFMLHYLSAGLTGMGFILDSMFGIDYRVGITIATVIIACYTIYGGFVTVAWADLFQGTFLLLVLLVVPFIAIGHEGGIEHVMSTAQQLGRSTSLLPEWSLHRLSMIFFLAFGWGLGYFGQPHILTKFMGIRSPDDLHKSKYVGMTWQVLALTGAAFVGLVGVTFFHGYLENPELVFVEMVKALFTPFVAGFILCAILAATISTMDSQILVSAGVLTEDIYRLVFHRIKRDDVELLNKSRWSVALTALAAYLMAMSKNRGVMDTVVYSWTGLGCSFGPLVLMALYYPKGNRYGAVAGILTGGIVAATWGQLGVTFAGNAVPAMIPGFALATLVIYLVSKATAKETARLSVMML